MIGTFTSSLKYVQGEGALTEIEKYIKYFGNKGLVIASHSALVQWENYLKDSLKKKEIILEDFGGKECSKKQINRLLEIASKENVNFVICFGGGKAQDVAKAVSFKMGDAPIALIPTIASSDAPLPPLSVIYKEDGSFESYWYFNRCVDLILVDTMIIANAPVRYLVAGMGDALSTKFEAEACKLSGNAIADCFSSELVIEVCNLCYKILMEYGVMAKESVEKRLVTPALDKIVGVNTLLSGLGAANDVAAAAHAIHDGFTILEETHKFLHGEKVGFCTIAQLLLEGRSPILINEVIDFCYKVGLPISLSDLNITNDIEEKISKVAGSVSKWIKNEPFEVTEKSIFNSIMLTDSIGENFKKGKNLKEIL